MSQETQQISNTPSLSNNQDIEASRDRTPNAERYQNSFKIKNTCGIFIALAICIGVLLGIGICILSDEVFKYDSPLMLTNLFWVFSIMSCIVSHFWMLYHVFWTYVIFRK